MIVEKGIKPELRWFYESKFGMFIHFGLPVLLDDKIEKRKRIMWAMYDLDIPRNEYEKLMDKFNPVNFKADDWVNLAQEAGAKYLNVVTKHHDGFCLFDSKLTDFKITNTPFQRDLIGEVIDSCHKHDMPVILYYSPPDWHHPNFVHNKGAVKDLDNPPPEQEPDREKYIEYFAGQIKELCTNYGKIDGIWFDGSHKTREEWDGEYIYDIIKKHHPRAVVNDRVRYGDFFTPERSLPDDLTGYMFEACQSVSPDVWGYRKDIALFSVSHLIKSLQKMAGAGGNYLLNVTPKPDGTIPQKQQLIMKTIGKWLDDHGQAVYKTHPLNLNLPEDKFRITRKENMIYIHFLEWPKLDRFEINGMKTPVKEITLLKNNQKINFIQEKKTVEVLNLPSLPPGIKPQVLRLEFKEKPEIEEIKIEGTGVPVIEVNSENKTELTAGEVKLKGYGVKGHRLRIKKIEEYNTRVITGWMVPEHTASWKIKTSQEKKVEIRIKIAYDQEFKNTELKLSAGNEKLQENIEVKKPEKGRNLEEIKIGTINLKPGVTELEISPSRLKWGYVFFDIEKVILKSIK